MKDYHKLNNEVTGRKEPGVSVTVPKIWALRGKPLPLH